MKKDRRVYIFISHSHQDIDKVRVIRNYLESLNGEPILFFLLSQTDKNKITKLIKEEIEARIWFILCDSDNAKQSEWVKSEIEFANEIGKHNIVNIPIDKAVVDYEVTDEYKSILSVVYQKFEMLSNIFVSYNHRDQMIIDKIDKYLNRFGIDLFSGMDVSFLTACSDWRESVEEKIKNAGCAITFIGEDNSLAQPVEDELIHKYNKKEFYVRLMNRYVGGDEKSTENDTLQNIYPFNINDLEVSADGLIKWLFDRI